MDFILSKFFTARLKHFDLDENALASLARLWPIIEPALEPAIDGFVSRDSKMPTVSAIFAAHGAAIRDAELRHFRFLLSGQLGDAYRKSCVDLCGFYASVGLTPRVRITCCNRISGAILDLLSRRAPFSAGRLARRVGLLSSVLSFDMTTIISTFDDAAVHERNARDTLINGAIGDFQAAVESVIGNLQNAAAVLSDQTEAMLGGVGETNRRTQSAARTAVVVRDNVDAAITSSSELEMSIAEINRQGVSSLDMAQIGGDDAKASMQVMNELAAAAQEIGSITRSISELADQTNLLSLNATIEAARAGASGRGFAVVAAEVQSLAQQTRSAAKKIADQVAAVQEASTKTVDQIATVVNRMSEIALVTSAISSAVCEQEAATRSIVETVRRTASATSQASHDVEAIESVASQNVKAAEEIAAWADRLTQDAGQLGDHVRVFFSRVRQA